ncbi:hypothetical protein MTR_5g019100 [Medicago truncatula]|uniref:Uncharacterized protein n=1 Tax=Medicago truncatula TaxID=3880 RepID=G7KAU0_MEDTR|nr:hypothetical protein MTR_5g019100 [Medicago truncatula]
MVNHCGMYMLQVKNVLIPNDEPQKLVGKDLLGIGRACFEMLRPLGYSLLAEIAHHVWQNLFQSHECYSIVVIFDKYIIK